MLCNASRRSVLFFAVFLAYGLLGPTLAFSSDEEAIVGRWDLVLTEEEKEDALWYPYMRFHNDHSFTSTLAFFATKDGRFRFLSDKIVELDTPGFFYGRNQTEFRFVLEGDSLRLINNHVEWRFKRVDSGK